MYVLLLWMAESENSKPNYSSIYQVYSCTTSSEVLLIKTHYIAQPKIMELRNAMSGEKGMDVQNGEELEPVIHSTHDMKI